MGLPPGRLCSLGGLPPHRGWSALSRVVDLFFEEFYEELERVVEGLRGRIEPKPLPAVVRMLRRRWRSYMPKPRGNEGVVIAVDGGVQSSTFAYGGFAAVGRACALIYSGGESSIVKRVKLYIGEAYDDAEREGITRYVRMIAEYSAAYEAVSGVLDEGGKPLLLMDGSLRPMGIPKRPSEYLHHPDLIAELLGAIASLHALSAKAGFPLTAIAKDSTALNIHIALLREIAEARGLIDLLRELEAATPQRLQHLFRKLGDGAGDLAGALLCDTALVRESTRGEGYTTPLLLAPPQQWRTPQMIEGIDEETARRIAEAMKLILSQPGVASTIFRPQPESRPLRVDFLSTLIGYDEPWESYDIDGFIGDGSLAELERLLDQLAYWFCNEVEYNIPLYQADLIARFDRGLYESRYEPLIVSRLEAAGLSLLSRRRVLRL